jgi:hypothetical protein
MDKLCKDLMEWIETSYAVSCTWGDRIDIGHGGSCYGAYALEDLKKTLIKRGYPNKIEVYSLDQGWLIVYNG